MKGPIKILKKEQKIKYGQKIKQRKKKWQNSYQRRAQIENNSMGRSAGSRSQGLKYEPMLGGELT